MVAIGTEIEDKSTQISSLPCNALAAPQATLNHPKVVVTIALLLDISEMSIGAGRGWYGVARGRVHRHSRCDTAQPAA
eukprot:361451-Chlamydomonas_euryale.AAC.1